MYKLRDHEIMKGVFVYNTKPGNWSEYTEIVNFNPGSKITMEECVVAIMRIYDLTDKS